MSLSRNFGIRLRELRRVKGISLQTLEDELSKVGLKFDTNKLSRIERGARVLSLDEAEELATFFEVSVREMAAPIDLNANIDLLISQKNWAEVALIALTMIDEANND